MKSAFLHTPVTNSLLVVTWCPMHLYLYPRDGGSRDQSWDIPDPIPRVLTAILSEDTNEIEDDHQYGLVERGGRGGEGRGGEEGVGAIGYKRGSTPTYTVRIAGSASQCPRPPQLLFEVNKILTTKRSKGY